MRGELLLLLLSLTLAKTEVDQTIILQYEKYTIPDIKYVCLNYEITANISEQCGEQLEVVCGNVTLYATMLDATSKFPYTGMGYSSRADYGNFDQCLTIDHKYAGGRILGKHCNAGLIIPDILGNVSDINSFYQLSLCKPDACSAEDYTAIANNLMEGLPLIFQDAMCQTIETGKDITTSDIVTIIIIAVVVLMMIVSTAYDFYLHRTQSETYHPLFLAFSILSNGKKLLQISKNSKQQIQTFHGLKMISMMWIVAGHGFALTQAMNVTNLPDIQKWMLTRYSGYITTAHLAVDTFFFISGFLLAFQYLKVKARPLKQQIFSIPQMYLHRYLRLTPAMLMVFLVTISIFRYFGSGPMWAAGTQSMNQTCRDLWWPFFLYIQNYYIDFSDMCLSHTWYLSADMQLFLLSPLVMIPVSLVLEKSNGFKMSMIGLLILNIFSTFLPMILKLADREYYNEYDTHSRLINYFIGMMLAVFMRVKIDKPFLYMLRTQHIRIVNLVIWTVILLGMLTTVICYQEVELYHGYESKSVFYSLMRPAWCIGLSWIVYSCYHGYGGIVNWILTGSIMQVFGRLTYCIYLLHIWILIYQLFALRNKIYFSDYTVFYAWCGHFTVSTVLAIFWTLAFESPLIIIEKHLLGGGNAKRKEPPQHISNGEKEKRENVY